MNEWITWFKWTKDQWANHQDIESEVNGNGVNLNNQWHMKSRINVEWNLNEGFMDIWTSMSRPNKNYQWPDEMIMNGPNGTWDAMRMGLGSKDTIKQYMGM